VTGATHRTTLIRFNEQLQMWTTVERRPRRHRRLPTLTRLLAGSAGLTRKQTQRAIGSTGDLQLDQRLKKSRTLYGARRRSRRGRK